MNCATALGLKVGSPLANQNVAYQNNAALVTKASGFTDFFTNPHVTACGAVTTCSLKVAGCGGAYSTGNLEIDNSGEITAKQNVDAGYEDTVCIECSNGHDSSVTHDNWKVTQAPNCATLTPATLTNQAFAYAASATSTTVYTSS
jgi:hypothetical protein